MNIAEPLKKMMDEKKVSRSRLGREIGVHTSTVSNWLDGKDVKLENLATLCSYFDCTMDYFVGDELMNPVPPEQSTRGMTSEERAAHYWGLRLEEQKEKPADQVADGLTEEELLRISAAMAQMNKEGRERAVELVEDLAAGGRFKKPGQAAMGKEA